jgi:putative endonuclease
MERRYFVYIMTNKNNSVLYTGVTGNLANRVTGHKGKQVAGFTSRYNVVKLVYYEVFDNPYSAIQREKQLKAGSRIKKIRLIDGLNSSWKDLSDDFV